MIVEPCDLMDYIDEELAVILRGDFPGCHESSPAGSDNSSSTLKCTAKLSAHPHEPPNNFTNISAPIILNFGNTNNSSGNSRNTDMEVAVVASDVLKSNHGPNKETRKRALLATKTSRVRPASQTYDHILAERKRREQLSQCFISLSAIVPGLKKMDKTSVLGDTITYLKHLQDKVKSLEEQTAKETMESIVLVKKTLIVEDEGSSDEKSLDGPEIEARVCGNSILLKVHCLKRKGVLVRLLAEVENLSLDVVSTSVTRFGSFTLDITVVAEMEKEIRLSGKDIMKALRLALQTAGN